MTSNNPFMGYLELKILKRLKDFAKLYKKTLEARAKELSTDKNLTNTNNFWICLLDCLKYWGQKFPSLTDGSPTKFKTVYLELAKCN